MNDDFDRKDVAHFAFISATSIPSTNANLSQPILSNQAASIPPLPSYAYLNDASGNNAYYFQTNSLQPQLGSFPQQPSVAFENFANSFNSGQSPGYQFNQPIMMAPQVNPNSFIRQEAATGTQDIVITNPFQNQQYLYSPNPQPQEIFSSTLNNSYFGTNPPSFFNNANSNISGIPNVFIRPESMINQIPQLQRFNCINGNDLSFSSPTYTPIQANWSFASKQLNGAKEIVNRAAPSNVEAQQNYLLRIEQVTLINAIPIDSNIVASEQFSSNQSSTNIQHKYIANAEGLTILSQVGDNKPQVMKIDSECIKQMLKNNSCFYIQQFLNGPKGKLIDEETSAMQTDGSLRTDIVEIVNQISEPTDVIQILEPRDLPAEEVCEDLHKKSSDDDLEYDGKGVAKVNGRPLGENESKSEPEPRSVAENNEPFVNK